MVSFTNSKSMHTIHSWVQGLAKRNLLAIAVCNGGPAAVIPFNGTKGIFGTNPMAYGMPDGKGGIICIDMATSEAPYFEILDANDAKKSLREHIAVDQNGEFTTDPSKALDFSLSKTDPISNLVPIGGGYKGYYISYLMEIMTSGLIHMPSSPEMSTDFVAEEHGAFILAFSPKAFGSEKAFLKSIKTVNEKIKKQKPKKGENIRVPGEGNTKRFDNLKNKEIDVSDDLFEKINKLSK